MQPNALELTALKYLAARGGSGNVLEVWKFDSSAFDEAFSMALAMENKDLVKLLYSNFNKKLIVLEMTLIGYAAIQ